MKPTTFLPRMMAAVLMLLTSLALGQPGTARGEEAVAAFSGAVPSGGTALLVTTNATRADRLDASLLAAGCDVTSLAVAGLGSGSLLVYVPGAPDFVNGAFPAELQASTPVAASCKAVADAPLDLANTTFTIGASTVPLRDGHDEQDIVPGSATRLRTWLSDRQAYGDLTGDGAPDAAAVLIHDPGGSGTFYYVAAVFDDGGSAAATNALLLGDRVTIERVEVADGAVIVTMLDRHGDESFASKPSVRMVRRFSVANGTLVEVGPAVCDISDLGGSSFVFVTSPASGARVASGFSVTGCSRTFESTVNWELYDRTGNELASGFTTGGGVDGGAAFAFDVEYALAAPSLGRLEVFEVDVSGGEGFPPPRAVVPLMLASEPGQAQQLIDTSWRLVTLSGVEPLTGTEITAQFAGREIGGSSGCNLYTGGYLAAGAALTVETPFAATLAACAAEVMDQEHAYLAALATAQSFAIEEGTLVIATASGDLTFSAANPQAASFEFLFDDDDQGWTAGFADLPAGTDPNSWELDAGHRQLPAGLSGAAIYIQGNNHSDDLFMYLTREVTGLIPHTTYRIIAGVDLATNIGVGGVGIGGSPGDSVYVKLGASTVEPRMAEDGIGHLRLNVDKGNQSNGGRDMVVVGNVAHPEVIGDEYRIKTLDSVNNHLEVTTDADGRLWLIVGTDSGFEGLSGFYWSRISYWLTPAE